MKRYLVVSNESMQKILNCFSSQEEFEGFSIGLGDMIDEFLFAAQLAKRKMDDDAYVSHMAIKQLFVFALFCRQNIDLVHELIKVLEYTEITEEKKSGLDIDKSIEID